MTREELKNNLVDFKDLKKRFGYLTTRGVRKRAQYDQKFPKPIKVMGNGAKIFWLPDIEEYEKLRGKIDISSR